MANRSSGELKRLAREFLTGNYTMLIVAMLITSLLPALILAPFLAGVSARLDAVMITFVTASVIIKILGQLLETGLIRMHLKRAQNQPYSYQDLFWTFRSQPDRFILAAALFYAVLLVPVIAGAAGVFVLLRAESAAGYVLLAPVIVAAAAAELYFVCMFGLIFPLYIDYPEMTVMDGFRTSRKLMKGNKFRFFYLQLSFAGWQVLGFLSVGIGNLWIGPYIRQTMANFYLDLTGQFDKKDAYAPDRP